MFKIVKNNQIMAIVESPRYVKIKPSTGVWIQCTEEEAEAVTVDSLLYNLPGLNNVPEADTVEIIPCEWNEFILDNINQTAALQAQVDYITMMTELDGSLDEEPIVDDDDNEEQDEEEQMSIPVDDTPSDNSYVLPEDRSEGYEGDEDNV